MPDSPDQPSGRPERLPPSTRRRHGDRLEQIVHKAIEVLSGPWGTVALLALLAMWAIAIPIFGWSRTYRTVVDLASISSLVLVVLILRAQTKAVLSIQVKLNELLAAVHRASPELINIEDRSEGEVQEIHDRFQELQQRGPGAHSIAETREADQGASADDLEV